MALGHACEQALEPEAAEVVGGLGRGVGRSAAQVWEDSAGRRGAEAERGEGANGEAAEGDLQREGTGVAKAERLAHS